MKDQWMPEQWKRQVDRGGSGGNDGGMEARLAKVEAAVQHIDTQLTDVKTDIREIRGDIKALLGAGIVALLLALSAMATSHLLLSAKIDSVLSEIKK